MSRHGSTALAIDSVAWRTEPSGREAIDGADAAACAACVQLSLDYSPVLLRGDSWPHDAELLEDDTYRVWASHGSFVIMRAPEVRLARARYLLVRDALRRRMENAISTRPTTPLACRHDVLSAYRLGDDGAIHVGDASAVLLGGRP